MIKIKADELEIYGDGEKGKFTNFEILRKKVEVLQEELILVSKILEQNNLVFLKEMAAETDDGKLDDEVYKRLENE